MLKILNPFFLLFFLGTLISCDSESSPDPADNELDGFTSKFTTIKDGTKVNWQQGYFSTSSNTSWEIYATTQPLNVQNANHDYILIGLHKQDFLTEGNHELEDPSEMLQYYTVQNDTYNDYFECETLSATVVISSVDSSSKTISGTYQATLCGSIISEMTVSGTFTELEYQ